MQPIPLMALLVAALATTANAQTVTVTTAADVVDIPTSGTVASLPGPDGKVSFSEAMIATNNTAGHQTVGFAIPKSEWIFQNILPGRAVLMSSVGFYWRANDSVTIDGTTQTKFTGETNPDGGAEVVFYGKEVYLNASGSQMLGIDGSSVSISGSNCVLRDNTGGMNISVFQGGSNLIRDNDCGTIKIDRSSDNIVIGNTASRIRIWGTVAKNNRVGGPSLAERNYFTGYGVYNSEGIPAGTTIQLFSTENTLVENNWIGTTTDGLSQGNTAATIGIGFEGDNVGTIIRNNLIAGFLGRGIYKYSGYVFGWAVYFQGSGSNIEIANNTVGLDANGAATLGSVWGIDVGYNGRSTTKDVTIRDNVIAGHRYNGITVGQNVHGVRLAGNTLYQNTHLGIDLVTPRFDLGPTPNDNLDVDTGGNGLQNFPVIAGAQLDRTSTRVSGTLHSSPLTKFTLEFFASATRHSSGYGEGKIALGTTTVTTDVNGNATFDTTVNQAASIGWFVCGTATEEPSGNTSEFGQSVAVVARTADVVLYGAACRGSVGLLTFTHTGLPAIGNASFAVGATGTKPGTATVMVTSAGPANLPFAGCTILVDLASTWFLVPLVSDSLGIVRTPMPIPQDPSLAGARLFAQWFNFDAASTNLSPLGGGATTEGAEIIVGR
ncbi:MAG: hypothetical protein KDC95_14030 [Planctomycetes bacterium]|nr:hypothetical protein [Planctomycetota bacterium]